MRSLGSIRKTKKNNIMKNAAVEALPQYSVGLFVVLFFKCHIWWLQTIANSYQRRKPILMKVEPFSGFTSSKLWQVTFTLPTVFSLVSGPLLSFHRSIPLLIFPTLTKTTNNNENYEKINQMRLEYFYICFLIQSDFSSYSGMHKYRKKYLHST